MSDAFQSVVDAHYRGLYRFALSLARHPADACDLTQQTFLIWAQKGHTLREQARAKTWLFTTLYREFLKTRRGQSRNEVLDEVDESRAELTTEAASRLMQVDGEAVLTALAALDEVFRAPVALFYLEEMSYNEIAETLGIPAGTVMSRLSRGKTLLRTALLDAGKAKVVPFSPGLRRTQP
ncbi:RNA polymerase sigma factor [Nibricoccus sp. IMCC34717]|uniref:RNA polymerase sigma factor n=1 Tax=Nibricoccus sp. IMCC34717 TaxID=3034021 RepID=UPI00384C90B5